MDGTSYSGRDGDEEVDLPYYGFSVWMKGLYLLDFSLIAALAKISWE